MTDRIIVRSDGRKYITNETAQPEKPIAYFDFQERGFYWASNTAIGPVPVARKVEPMPLYSNQQAQPEPSETGLAAMLKKAFWPSKLDKEILDLVASQAEELEKLGMDVACMPDMREEIVYLKAQLSAKQAQSERAPTADTIEQARKGCGSCSFQTCDFPQCLKQGGAA